MRIHAVLATFLVAALAWPAHGGAQQIADEQSRRQAMDLYRAGQGYMAAERFGAAVESFTAAVSKDPLLAVAHYQLGQAHMALKQYENAIQAYQGSVEALKALHSLEQTNRFEVDKQRQETIRELRTELNGSGMKIDPLKRTVLEQRVKELEMERTASGQPFQVPGFVLLAMGSAHFRNGDRDAAVSEWQSAVAANSKLGEAHNNLAVVYMLTGKKVEAENAVKAAEKAGFRVNPQLKADIAKLQN
jgi:tetratricopeptide (TPR) repeat protein